MVLVSTVTFGASLRAGLAPGPVRMELELRAQRRWRIRRHSPTTSDPAPQPRSVPPSMVRCLRGRSDDRRPDHSRARRSSRRRGTASHPVRPSTRRPRPGRARRHHTRATPQARRRHGHRQRRRGRNGAASDRRHRDHAHHRRRRRPAPRNGRRRARRRHAAARRREKPVQRSRHRPREHLCARPARIINRGASFPATNDDAAEQQLQLRSLRRARAPAGRDRELPLHERDTRAARRRSSLQARPSHWYSRSSPPFDADDATSRSSKRSDSPGVNSASSSPHNQPSRSRSAQSSASPPASLPDAGSGSCSQTRST